MVNIDYQSIRKKPKKETNSFQTGGKCVGRFFFEKFKE